MRNFKWGIIKGGASVSAFALTVKAKNNLIANHGIGLIISGFSVLMKTPKNKTKRNGLRKILEERQN